MRSWAPHLPGPRQPLPSPEALGKPVEGEDGEGPGQAQNSPWFPDPSAPGAF